MLSLQKEKVMPRATRVAYHNQPAYNYVQSVVFCGSVIVVVNMLYGYNYWLIKVRSKY